MAKVEFFLFSVQFIDFFFCTNLNELFFSLFRIYSSHCKVVLFLNCKSKAKEILHRCCVCLMYETHFCRLLPET